ncbi:MAG: hypothetical protein Q8O72_16615 [Bacteroidales bacterium]|nr:hypothetical protein [Bacteroidales bacterium]
MKKQFTIINEFGDWHPILKTLLFAVTNMQMTAQALKDGFDTDVPAVNYHALDRY